MQSFSWLIQDVIAASGIPGRLFIPSPEHISHPIEKLENDLRFLWDQGIRAILSLTEQPLDLKTVQYFSFDYLHLPISDMTTPAIDQILLAIAFIERSVGLEKPLLTHCLVGRGRTGTILACYMVWKGQKAQQAITGIRDIRPGSIETLDQERTVVDYEAFLKDGGKNKKNRTI